LASSAATGTDRTPSLAIQASQKRTFGSFSAFAAPGAAKAHQVAVGNAERTGIKPIHTMRHPAITICLVSAASLLAGCEALGIETATQIAAKKEAEAKAIGSACRHAVRSIEDCFGSNPRAGKAAVFAGWREMDEYMRENAIVGMPGESSTRRPESVDMREPGASDPSKISSQSS